MWNSIKMNKNIIQPVAGARYFIYGLTRVTTTGGVEGRSRIKLGSRNFHFWWANANTKHYQPFPNLNLHFHLHLHLHLSFISEGKIRWKFRRKGAFEFVFFDSANSSVEKHSREFIFFSNR